MLLRISIIFLSATKSSSLNLPLIFPATLREIYHPDEAALAALSEEFGAYKYIDFQEDSNGRNGAAGITQPTLALGITLIALLGGSRAFV